MPVSSHGARTAKPAAGVDNCGSDRSASGCPGTVQNHESQVPPNQRPAPDQKKALPTNRETSSIPNAAGGDPLWVYPSQQQFFNAMRRKGYAPNEEEMDAVVAIHNAVNERAWAEVVEWESTLHPECVAGMKLVRFQGKPGAPRPAATVARTKKKALLTRPGAPARQTSRRPRRAPAPSRATPRPSTATTGSSHAVARR